MTARALLVLIAPLLVVSGCAGTIHGTVQLVDSRQQPIANESPTATVEVGSFGKKVEFKLKKIEEAKRKSIKGSTTDEDKIINPGEVNIQAPAM